GTGKVTLVASNDLRFAASNFGSGVTSVTVLDGSITQSGAITTTGTALLPAYASFDANGGDMLLNNAGHDFATAGTPSRGRAAAGGGAADSPTSPNSNFTLVDINAIQLGNITVGTGNLSVTAGGSITQASTINGVPANGIRTGANLSSASVTFTSTLAASDIL